MPVFITVPVSGVGDVSAGAVTVTQGEKDAFLFCKEFWEASSLSTLNSGSNASFVWRGRKDNTALRPRWSGAPTLIANAINTSLPAVRFASQAAIAAPADVTLIAPGQDYSAIIIYRNPTGTAGNGTLVANGRDAETPGYFAFQARSDKSVQLFHRSNEGALISTNAAFSDDIWYAMMVTYDQSEADAYTFRNQTGLGSNTSVGHEITTDTGGTRFLVGSAGRTAQAATANGDIAAIYVFDIALHLSENATILTAIRAHITAKYGIAFS